MSGNHSDSFLAGVPFSELVAELHRRGWTDERIVDEIANQSSGMTPGTVRRLWPLLAERSPSA